MLTIEIDNKTCIKCGKCVKVCPAYILTQTSPKDSIGVRKEQNCIVCGHCVSACPTDSVVHSEFPPQKVHLIDRTIIPSPEQMMELFKSRRSNRAFLSKPVPENYLRQIIEAAHLAPTASNGQEISFTLVTNPEMIKQISNFTINVFEDSIRILTNPILKPLINIVSREAREGASKMMGVIKKQRSGDYDAILRGANTVLFFHAPKGYNFGSQDANLAYQNASLMAESLGVTQFYTGYVCRAIKMDQKRKLAKLLNIENEIYAGMALAMPAFKFGKYTDRKNLNLTII